MIGDNAALKHPRILKLLQELSCHVVVTLAYIPLALIFLPATTTLPTPGDCSVQDLDPQAKLFYNLTFLRLSKPDDLVVTPDGVLRATGDPQLNSVAGTLGRTITFDGTDDAAELECIPCISNLLNCMTGFTLQVDVNLKQAPASIEVMRDDTQIGYVAISEPNLVQSQTNSELTSEESKQDAPMTI